MGESVEEREARHIADLIRAMKDPNVTIQFQVTFTHGTAVRVKIGRRNIGPLLFPVEGQTIADVLAMLGNMREEEDDDA